MSPRKITMGLMSGSSKRSSNLRADAPTLEIKLTRPTHPELPHSLDNHSQGVHRSLRANSTGVGERAEECSRLQPSIATVAGEKVPVYCRSKVWS